MDIFIRVENNVQNLNFCIVACKFCVCLLIESFVVNFVQDSLIMFRRNRLPDSLRWRRSDGQKCGCRKLMLLDASMYLVVWSNDRGINLKSQIQCLEDLFQADHELRHLQKTVI